MGNKELTQEQLSAIAKSIYLGRTLQTDLGTELEQFYRQGGTLTQAVEHFGIQSRYKVGLDIARAAVFRALSGCEEGYLGRLPGYEGLIPDKEERDKMGREHNFEHGVRIYEEGKGFHGKSLEERSAYGRIGGLVGGRAAYEQRKGVHGLTQEQIIENASKAGKKGGRTIVENGLGVHSLTSEQRQANGRKAALARGKVPMSYEERRDAYEFSQKPEYQYPVGSNWEGKADNQKIVDELNRRYHGGKNVRTVCSMRSGRMKYKKSLEKGTHKK